MSGGGTAVDGTAGSGASADGKPVSGASADGAAATGSARTDPRGEIVLDHRPWGGFEQLTRNESCTVKILTVSAGHRLSLQRHQCRDELWSILEVPVEVQIGSRRWRAEPGEKLWIPRGTLHRATNRGERDGRILEVAFGAFDEADIERLEDDYAR